MGYVLPRITLKRRGKMFKKLLSDKLVLAIYTKYRASFGDFLNYSYLGHCNGFIRLLSKYEKWEAEIIKGRK
jgi:hypothetical protein